MNICDKCGKEFKYKYLLIRHKNKKKDCNKLNEIDFIYRNKIIDIDKKIIDIKNDIINNDNKIEDLDIKNNRLEKKILLLKNKSLKIEKKCLFCNKDFSNKTNLLRHINNNCTENKDFNNKKLCINEDINRIINDNKELQENINKLEEDKNKIIIEQQIKQKDDEIKKLKECMEKMIDNQSKNINITNNKVINNKIINNNLVVNINSFGKETLKHITLDDYKKFLSGFFPGFIKYIEKIHFDEKAPENHNIYITNLKSKYIHIFENNQWMTKAKSDIIDKFIEKKYGMLIDKCEELEENNEISNKISEEFSQFMKNYEDEEAKRNTKNKIIMMLYNNKDKINK